jgi:hypothetical protein
MRKILMLLGLVAALAIPTIALAATLDTGKFGDQIAAGDKCPKGAFYHIVNVQSGGADDATLDVVFSNETKNDVASYQSPGNTTHYLVFSTGELLSASNALPGFLVISDYACKK